MYQKRNNWRGQRRNNSGSHGSRGYRSRTFDPRTFIENAGNSSAGKKTSQPQVTHEFSDFRLDQKLYQNIKGHGFSSPTPIQDQAIPHIVGGRDVVGIANTGTGKTAAFLVPLINKVANNRKSKVLIIAPTRELAVQIDAELQSLSRNMGIYSAVAIGGVSIGKQINALRRNPQFVIGTPGRLLDLEQKRKISFNQFDSIVLDEVDRMLDMGFIHDINKIISKLPRNRQSLFFSATMDPKVKDVMGKFIGNPITVSVKTADSTENVDQGVVELKGRNKAEVLCELLDSREATKTLIFMRTKRNADNLHKSLSKIKFQTSVLHGNKSQSQRQRSLEQFRQGRVNILIATDVASRGIDVDDISHVINYDLPESYEVYIHRIGRTGRAGKKGTALTFIG